MLVYILMMFECYKMFPCFIYIAIIDKKCVEECLNNMQSNQELAPLEIVEMFVTIFCFLKDSSEVRIYAW